MSQPRDIDNYGGVFVDDSVVEDPTVEISSSFDNRLHEDAAQATRTQDRSWVTFQTTGTAGPIAVTVTAGRSMMGSGSGAYPTVTKSATGLYSVLYPASWVDGLGQTEVISFAIAWANAWGAGVTGFARVSTIVGSLIVIEVRDSAGAFSDLGGTANITVRGQ